MTKTNTAAPAGAFSLGFMKKADEAVLTITNPKTGAEWKVTFAGPNHPNTIKLRDQSEREALAERRQQEQARVNGRKWKAPETSPAAERRETAEKFARRMLGWSPEIVLPSGEALAFSHANAVKLILDPDIGNEILNMFVEFVAAEDAFTEKSAQN